MKNSTALWRNRDFMVLWTGQTLSVIGSSMSIFLFPVVGYSVTGSTTQAALSGTSFLLGSATTRLPAGALADRWNRRFVMSGSAGAGAMLYAGMTIALLLDVLTLPMLLATAFLTGVVSAFFAPAEAAAVRKLVSSQQLPTALSQNQARQFTASLAGPPLGGALYAITAWIPFLVDTLSYLTAAAAALTIRHPLAPPADALSARLTLRADILEGLRYLLSRGVFRAIAASAALVNFAISSMFLVLTLKLLRAGVPTAAIGSIETVAAGAGILGALTAPWLIRNVPTGRIVLTSCVLIPAGTAPMAFSTNVVVLGALLAAAILGLPGLNAAIDSYLFSVTPDRLQGRVNAGLGFTTSALQPAGPLVGGLLMAWVGSTSAMLLTSAVITSGMLVLATCAEVRRLSTPDGWVGPELSTDL
ncbi:MAG: MFS transporter [Nocardioidaceae bacterium]